MRIFKVVLASQTAYRTVRTSTSALLQILLSNFKLRTLEMLGPRERCCPRTQEHKIINASSQLHKPFGNSFNHWFKEPFSIRYPPKCMAVELRFGS